MPTPEEFEAWRADVCRWVEDCVFVQSPATGEVEPLRLADHQSAFLREATRRGVDGHFVHRTCVASWPRREGKSLCVALIVGWRTFCFERQRSLVLANSEKQAQSNVFTLLVDMIGLSPVLSGQVREQDLSSGRVTVPVTGSTCTCEPCNWRTVQGRPRQDVLAADELHAAENPKAFEFASNQLEALDAQCLISSQAGGPILTNPMWRLYQARERPWILFDYRSGHMLPWAAALGQRERETLLPGEWQYMHENQWGQTGLKLFPSPVVERAAMAYTEPETREEWGKLVLTWKPARLAAIGAGLDRAGVAKTGDRSVWTVVARLESPGSEAVFRVVRCAVLPRGSEAEVLAEVRRTEAVFGRPSEIRLERYDCSDLVGKVRGATLEAIGSQVKQRLCQRVSRLFEEGRMGFPADAGSWRDERGRQWSGMLKAELVGFEYEMAHGDARFGTQRGHDDCVLSLAWAVEAAAAGSAGLQFWA
jgi:hypothetical protein